MNETTNTNTTSVTNTENATLLFNVADEAAKKKRRPRPVNMRKKDKALRRARKLKAKCRPDTKIKKNIRHKQPIEFQVKGQLPLKFCREITLTPEVKKVLGRCVYKIIPEAIRNPEYLPHLLIYRDTQTNCLVIKAQLAEHEDYIVTDGNGNAEFQPDIEFGTKRFKRPVKPNAKE